MGIIFLSFIFWLDSWIYSVVSSDVVFRLKLLFCDCLVNLCVIIRVWLMWCFSR